MLLPDAIRHARKELGLTQQKLADLAGIERKQLSILEGGGNVTLATLRKILIHLPNLRTFELDAASGTVVRVATPEAARTAMSRILPLLTEAVRIVSEGPGPAVPADVPAEPVSFRGRGASDAFASMAALAARRKQRR